MNQDQYLKILGLERGATTEQIKKAYRRKARLYHPDLNKKKTATEIFIAVNEAYEYLLELRKKQKATQLSTEDKIKDWNQYRREQARKRAYQYSRRNYNEFKKSKNYKSSIILNKVQLFINLSVGVFVCTMAIIGYVIKLRMVKDGYSPPTLGGFILLLLIGTVFILVSLAHILVFYQNQRSRKNNEEKN